MGAAFATSAPTNQVEDLMKQVAAENDLDITEQLKDLHPGQSTLEASAAEPSKEESLSRRYLLSNLSPVYTCVLITVTGCCF